MSVFDASVALKWVIEEARSPSALRSLQAAEIVIAPELIPAEACNAGWRLFRAGLISAAQHDGISPALIKAFELVPLQPLASRAAEISRHLDHPIYDCLYLALAALRSEKLVTADGRLLKRLQGTTWDGIAEPLAP